MKTFLTSLLLTIFLIGCLLLIFIFSPIGLKAAIGINNYLTSHPIHYQALQGNITGPIRIEGLNACSNKGCATIDQMYFSWSPSQLFFRHFAIDDIRINHITLTENHSPHTTHKKKQHSSKNTPKFHTSIKHLTINQLSAQTRLQQDIQAKKITLRAVIHPKQITVKAHLTLTQPYSSQYMLNITGQPNAYTILANAQGKQSHLQWQGTGNLQGFKIHSTDHRLSQGSLQSDIQYQWSPHPSWKINLDAKNIRLNQWNAHWPSSLSLNVNSEGSFKKNHPNMNFNIQGHTPKTSLALYGEARKTANIHWNFKSQSLNELYPQLKGTINTSGQVTGSYTLPTIKADLSTTGFHFKDINIQSLKTNGLIDLSQQQRSSLLISGSQLRIFNYPIQAFTLQSSGNLLDYEAYTKITHALGTVSTTVNGSKKDAGWDHHLQSFQLNTVNYGDWKLIHPSIIHTNSSQIQSEPLCFSIKQSQPNQTCINFHWQPNYHWSGSIDSHGTNMDLLTHHIVPSQTQLHGSLQLTATASGQSTHIQSATINSAVNNGKLTYINQKEIHTTPIKMAETHWAFKKHTLTTNTSIELHTNNHIAGKLTVHNLPYLTWPTDKQTISGSLSIQAQHLNAYSAFIPNVDLKNGSLNSKLNIQGTISAPQVTGETSLNHIQVFLPKIGLDISNIHFNIINHGYKTTYTGTLYSKQSPMTFNGTTRYKNKDWLTDLKLHGNNFLLMDSHEYKIAVSPDLTLTLKNKDIGITGNINIPKATIKPYQAKNVKRLPHSDIQYSAHTSKNPWTIHGDINATLGDQIYLSIIGIRGHAHGKVQISKKSQGSTLCNGHISVHGVYEAYGHKLTISPNSELTYNNNPITNPSLNLRATKKISNTYSLYQQDFSGTGVTVGIEVTGMLNHPILGLFSIPANLSQSDILSYLILGHAPNTTPQDNTTQQSTNTTANILDTIKLGETGLSSSDSGGISTNIQRTLGLSELGVENSATIDAAGNQLDQQNYFVLGKFIAPKIYARYSQGLMDNNDIIQFRLFITPQWVLQTETNSLDNSNGIDILYSIEK